jgi:hypothetical protein
VEPEARPSGRLARSKRSIAREVLAALDPALIAAELLQTRAPAVRLRALELLQAWSTEADPNEDRDSAEIKRLRAELHEVAEQRNRYMRETSDLRERLGLKVGDR